MAVIRKGDQFVMKDGTKIEVKRVAADHAWADILVTQPGGAAWTKRQPLRNKELPFDILEVQEASPIERRAYIENVAAQEAAYWYCRQHRIKADDLDIGQILQVTVPIILQEVRLYAERMLRSGDGNTRIQGADLLDIMNKEAK